MRIVTMTKSITPTKFFKTTMRTLNQHHHTKRMPYKLRQHRTSPTNLAKLLTCIFSSTTILQTPRTHTASPALNASEKLARSTSRLQHLFLATATSFHHIITHIPTSYIITMKLAIAASLVASTAAFAPAAQTSQVCLFVDDEWQ